MKIRKPKHDDQENADKTTSLVFELIKLNPEIEPSIWIFAFVSVITYSYLASNLSYQNFKSDMEEMTLHYKQAWEQK